MDSCNAWNGYAKEFNEFSSFDTKKIHTGLGLKGINPAEIANNAKTILDIGCGDGSNTYLLHSVNHGETIGVDVASVSIDSANRNYSKYGCRFYNMDFDRCCVDFGNINFDLITFFGSADYIKIDDEFMRKINNISHINSRCIITKFHPMWTTLYGNDIEDQNINCYFDDGRIDGIPYGTKHEFILNRYHYSISHIVSTYIKNGWKLNQLLEPKPSIKDASFEYKNYNTDEVLMERLSAIPMTIIYEFERICN